jgi:hypothetical protein
VEWWALPSGVLDDDSFNDDGFEDNDGFNGGGPPDGSPPDGDEAGMQWMDLPDDLQEVTPSLDNFLGGTLSLSMYGCMQQYDTHTLSEYTEYVVLCSWGTDQGNTEQWLVFTRYDEFRQVGGWVGR